MIQVSIIIPTYNRANYLADTLSTLGMMSETSSAELIVIDNGSTDKTREIVETFTKESPLPCRYVYEPTPGLHVGRNLGAQLAQGEILAYLDDDVFVDPDWLTGIQDAFTNYPELALLGGPCIPHWEGQPPQWILDLKYPSSDGGWVLSQLSLLDLGYQEPAPCSPWHIFGCNFIIRKSVLFAAGGFHPDGMPDHLLRYRGDGESYISRYIIDNKLLSMYHPACKIRHRVPEKRLSRAYIDYIVIRNIYSQAYTECRRTDFDFIPLLTLLAHLGWWTLKKGIHFLLRQRQTSADVRHAFLLFWRCLLHSLSPNMRAWICQPSYFKEDPCPYNQSSIRKRLS